MSYRFMRVLVLFDLPVLTGDQRREYARFQMFLLKNILVRKLLTQAVGLIYQLKIPKEN